jgi:hypothetical protein
MLAAALFAVAFVLLLAILIIRGTIWKASVRSPDLDLPPIATSGAPATPQIGLAGPVRGIRLDLLDSEERSRKIGELFLAGAEPLDERNYRVDEPRIWLFLEDGRSVHIQADAGRMFMPQRTAEPESGVLTGHVLIRLYERRGDGRRIDLNADEPRGMLRTESLYFDRALGELSTADTVLVTAPEFDAQVRGLLMIVSESRMMLERLETAGDGRVVLRPSVRSPAPAPPPSSIAAQPRQTGGQPPRPVVRTPSQLLYHIVTNKDVILWQEGRRIESDRLESWVRLIDGALPADAIAPVRIVAYRPEAQPGQIAADPPAAPPASEAAASPARPAVSARAPAAGAQGPAPTDQLQEEEAGDTVVLTWSGPAIVRPMEQAPAQLERNHLALRFTADEPNLVSFADAQSGARGRVPLLEYLATTRRMLLSGPAADSVVAAVPGAAALQGQHIETDLGAGIVNITGPVAITPHLDDGRPFRITAQEHSTFVLAREDGALTNRLERADLSGDVQMHTDEGHARAGHARADFIATPERPANLSHLDLREDAEIASRNGEIIRGQRIELAFQPGVERSQPDPTRLTAEGRVTVVQGGQTMNSDSVEAELARREGGPVEITTALARGAVTYIDAEGGIETRADELRYTAAQAGEAQLADLSGNVEIVRRDAEASTLIVGPFARIEPDGRILRVIGPGRFQHTQGDSFVVADWTTSMSFDDPAGIIEAVGDAHTQAWSGPLSVDRVQAERIVLHLTPAGEAEERRILRAHAIGGEGAAQASFESRRYEADLQAPEGRRMAQVMALQGAQIIADDERGTLDVPAAGRLLMVDRRQDPQAAEQNGPGAGPAGRGDTLMDWQGSLHMDRPAGVIEMERGIRATHRRSADGEVTDMTCNQLTARITPAEQRTGTAGSGLAGDLQLLSATARGDVHIESGPAAAPGQPPASPKVLTADEVDYDAVRGRIDARAREGGVVTLMGDALPAPVMLRALWWDMVNDRYGAAGIGTVTPR